MSNEIGPRVNSELETCSLVPPQRRNFGNPSPKAVDAEISFVEIRHILRRRKQFIVVSVISIFVLAVAYTLISAPRYQATSTIEFKLENSDVVPFDDAHLMAGDPNAMSYRVAQETQARALQSDSLALQVVEELKLANRPEFTRNQSSLDSFRQFPDESTLPLEKATHRRSNVLKAFHRNLTVKAIPGSRMIQISFLSPDAQLASSIVNTLVKDFQDQQFRIRNAATAQVADWLTSQLEDLKKQMETSREQLARYQNKAGILGIDETHNIVMTRLEEVDRQLVSAEANRMLAQTVWQLARSGSPELISSLAASSSGASLTVPSSGLALIENLRVQQSQLKLEYAHSAAKYGSEYPRLVQLKNQLNELDENIRAEVENLALRKENDYHAARQTEDALRASFEQAKVAAAKLNDSAIQYSILKREVESTSSLYDNFSKQLREAGILASVHPTNILTVDPAMPSDRPAKPAPAINLAMGLVIGLLVGIGGAFALENFDETITTPDQAEQLALAPSLGLVPRAKLPHGTGNSLKPKGRDSSYPPILMAYQCHSQIAEAYRSLRTSIMRMTRSNASSVLLFTSALPEEGKTITSLNCAAALAQQGLRVLLVEADMRRPNISKLLGLSGSTGLSSLLGGVKAPATPFKLASIPKLAVIPAGPTPQHPAELLGSPLMAEMIRTWRSEYDYVVIDTPPVLSVTDAVVVSAHCDAAVLVLRSGVTRKQSLLRVRDLFMRSQTRIAGVVVNGFDPKSADYAHYFGYLPTSKNSRGYYTTDGN